MKALRAERNARMDQRADATKTFYAALTPEQKKTFDESTLRFGHGDAERRPPQGLMPQRLAADVKKIPLQGLRVPDTPGHAGPFCMPQRNSVCSSPLAISRSRSAAPPTSVPRTNTIGKVGQPAHIFSAVRSRHWLR